MLVFFLFAFDEYCLQPVINYERRAKYVGLNTPQLEMIYMFCSLAMTPEMCFIQANKNVSMYLSFSQPKVSTAVWDSRGPLEVLKQKLYEFFKYALPGSAY